MNCNMHAIFTDDGQKVKACVAQAASHDVRESPPGLGNPLTLFISQLLTCVYGW